MSNKVLYIQPIKLKSENKMIGITEYRITTKEKGKDPESFNLKVHKGVIYNPLVSVRELKNTVTKKEGIVDLRFKVSKKEIEENMEPDDELKGQEEMLVELLRYIAKKESLTYISKQKERPGVDWPLEVKSTGEVVLISEEKGVFNLQEECLKKGLLYTRYSGLNDIREEEYKKTWGITKEEAIKNIEKIEASIVQMLYTTYVDKLQYDLELGGYATEVIETLLDAKLLLKRYNRDSIIHEGIMYTLKERYRGE